MEDVEAFRSRARAWLADNMPRRAGRREMTQDERVARNRELQRTLFDGGFAGIVYPSEYGGQGLTPAHQRAFTEESAPYEMPLLFNIPTLGILAPTLLEFGNDGRIVVGLEHDLTSYWVDPALEYRSLAHVSSQSVEYKLPAIQRHQVYPHSKSTSGRSR